MGFLSSLVDIHFPARNQILTVEASSTNQGSSYGRDGEPFNVIPPGPLGTQGPFTLIPSTLLQPKTIPIVDPLSSAMEKGAYDWTKPVPSYVSGDGTTGACVAFFNLSAISKLLKSSTVSLQIRTAAHGTSSSPPVTPVDMYYMYNTLNGSRAVNGGGAGQTWFDGNMQNAINLGILPPSFEPLVTDPIGDAAYAATLTSVIGSDLYYDAASAGLTFENPFPDLQSATAVMELFNQETPGEFAIFDWLQIPSPYQGQTACSWDLKVSTFKKRTSFPVNTNGTAAFGYDATSVQTISSQGSNPPAQTIGISVNMKNLELTIS